MGLYGVFHLSTWRTLTESVAANGVFLFCCVISTRAHGLLCTGGRF